MAAQRPTYIVPLPAPGEIDVRNRPAVLSQIIRWTERREWYPQSSPSTANPITQSILHIRREAISLLGRHKPGALAIHLRKLREDFGDESLTLPDWFVDERLKGEEGEGFEEKMINYLLVKLLETCRGRALEVCKREGVEGMMGDGFGVGVDVLEMVERRGVDGGMGVGGMNVHPAEQGQEQGEGGGGLPMKKNVVMVDGFEVDWEEMMKGSWVPAVMRDGRLVPVGEEGQSSAQTQARTEQARPPLPTRPARNPAVGSSRGGGVPTRDLPHRPRKEEADHLANNDGTTTDTRAQGKIESGHPAKGNGNLVSEIPVMESRMFEASVAETPVHKTDLEAELFVKLRFKPKPAAEPCCPVPVEGGPGAVRNESDTLEDTSCWMDFDAKEKPLAHHSDDDEPEIPPEAASCWMDFDSKEKPMRSHPTTPDTGSSLPTPNPAPVTYRQPYVEDAEDSDTESQPRMESPVMTPPEEDGGLPTPVLPSVPAVSDEPPDPPDETQDYMRGNPKVISITDILAMLEEDASLLVPTEVGTDIQDDVEEEVPPENSPESPHSPASTPTTPTPKPDTTKSQQRWSTPSPTLLPLLSPTDLLALASTPTPLIPLSKRTHLLPRPHPRSVRTNINQSLLRSVILLRTDYAPPCTPSSPCPQTPITLTSTHELERSLQLANRALADATRARRPRLVAKCHLQRGFVLRRMERWGEAYGDFVRAACVRSFAGDGGKEGMGALMGECVRGMRGGGGEPDTLDLENGRRDVTVHPEVPEGRMGLMRQGTFGSEVDREGEEEGEAETYPVTASRWSYSIGSQEAQEEQVGGPVSPIPDSPHSLLQHTPKNARMEETQAVNTSHWSYSVKSQTVEDETGSPSSQSSPSSDPERVEKEKMDPLLASRLAALRAFAGYPGGEQVKAKPSIGAKAEEAINDTSQHTVPTDDVSKEQQPPGVDENKGEDPSSPGHSTEASYQNHFSNISEYTGSTASEADHTPINYRHSRAQDNTIPTGPNPMSFGTWQIVHSAPNLDEIDWLSSGASPSPPDTSISPEHKPLESFYIRDAADHIIPSLKSPPALRSVRGRKFQLNNHGTVNQGFFASQWAASKGFVVGKRAGKFIGYHEKGRSL